MHALFFTFIFGYDSANAIKIDQDLTETNTRIKLPV